MSEKTTNYDEAINHTINKAINALVVEKEDNEIDNMMVYDAKKGIWVSANKYKT